MAALNGDQPSPADQRTSGSRLSERHHKAAQSGALPVWAASLLEALLEPAEAALTTLRASYRPASKADSHPPDGRGSRTASSTVSNAVESLALPGVTTMAELSPRPSAARRTKVAQFALGPAECLVGA
ncbi:hypothetical protein KQY30_02405 [Streptomyces sp. GMY02]|nr:hypothetical protein KQY30_02405 [Streptomyces sp. GMY02]